MKKLLGIIVLGLLLSGNAYAKCIKGDCVNGLGVDVLPDGRKYDGEFKDGKFEGQGTYTFANGGKYVGEFKKGFNGQGTFTSPNGDKYIGGWKDSLKTGQGTLTYANGTVKKGIWKENKFYKTEKKYLKYHREKNKIKKDVKLKCMLTYVDPYKQGESSFNEFYLTIDSINNQIIAGSFVKKWGLLNIIYDEINFNEDEAIIANTIIDYSGHKAHMRLYLDRYTGEMTVLSDVDYNDEGTKKSLEDKITGEGYSYPGAGHNASCVKKTF